MRIPEDMLWPIKLLIQEKPHLFSRKTKKHMTGAPQDIDSLLLVMQEDEQPLKRTEL